MAEDRRHDGAVYCHEPHCPDRPLARISPGGLWGALLFGAAYPLLGFWKTAQSENFLLPFLWWSLVEAICWLRREETRSLFLCGSALGMVFWFKYP